MHIFPWRYNINRYVGDIIWNWCEITYSRGDWDRNKTTDISQDMFICILSVKMIEFRLQSHWCWCLRVQLTIRQHWIRQWYGDEKVTNHYLNQCSPSSMTHICVTRSQRVKGYSNSQCWYQSAHFSILWCDGYVICLLRSKYQSPTLTPTKKPKNKKTKKNNIANADPVLTSWYETWWAHLKHTHICYKKQ